MGIVGGLFTLASLAALGYSAGWGAHGSLSLVEGITGFDMTDNPDPLVPAAIAVVGGAAGIGASAMLADIAFSFVRAARRNDGMIIHSMIDRYRVSKDT